MTSRFNQKGYMPTKRKQIDQYMDAFERKVGRALDNLNAGEITKDQFVNEIDVGYSNFKHNQHRIYNMEDNYDRR